MSGFVPSFTLASGKREDRLDEVLIGAAVAALESAPVDTPFLSGLWRDTDTQAGSDGHAYRDRLVKRQVPVSSTKRTVATIKAMLAATVPPLDIPEGTSAADAKQLRAAHAELVTAAYGPYADAPDDRWTWALIRVAVVRDKQGNVLAGIDPNATPEGDEDDGEANA